MPPLDGTGFESSRYAPARLTFIHGEVFSVLALPPATEVGIALPAVAPGAVVPSSSREV